MSDIKDDDEAYLEVDKEHIKTLVNPETVWAKIDEEGRLETLRWDIVEMYAMEYDTLKRSGKEPPSTYVICKLLVLVRDQVRKERG